MFYTRQTAMETTRRSRETSSASFHLRSSCDKRIAISGAHRNGEAGEPISFRGRMPSNLQTRIDAALASVRNNRLGLNVLEAGMVRDIATTLDGKVRFSILLSADDHARSEERR